MHHIFKCIFDIGMNLIQLEKEYGNQYVFFGYSFPHKRSGYPVGN